MSENGCIGEDSGASENKTNIIPVLTTIRNTIQPSTRQQNKTNLKVIHRSNNLIQALQLPTLANINPRSVYNKQNEFHKFVTEEEIDLIFLSESWERENMTLDQIIKLEDHVVISNVHQRLGKGGRPAIIANSKKYHVQNLTNSVISIKWGVEAVWCLLTPKNVTNDSKIQKIACAAIYSKPDSRHKTDLLDHISEAYNILSTKYPKGLHFCIAGDTNDLKLTSILHLSPSLVQIVNQPTRIDPKTGKESIIDPIIMTLSSFYQEPEYLDPLDSDPESNGKKSDHKIIISRPITVINNKSVRQTRLLKLRPITDSAIQKFRDWIIDYPWDEVYQNESAHEKANNFQNTLLEKFQHFFPQKNVKFNSDDSPWMTSKLKTMDRKRKRIYHKERCSKKWETLNKSFKKEVKLAKSVFYTNIVADLKQKKPSQWYSSLKRISSFDQHKAEPIYVDQISSLSDQEQAEVIADHFSSIPNEYDPLLKDDIEIPLFSEADIPQFHPSEVWLNLSRMRTNKSTVNGDLPARIIKIFAAYLTEPLTNIINSSLRRGEYPNIYKFEVSTPVPKTFPTDKVEKLRNISGLLNFDKIMSKMISQLMISDMEGSLDPAQFGNQKGLSIQHYLIMMIHRILTVADTNSKREVFAVIANLIDWKSAFPKQCPKLGIESFLQNGVRPSLIPLLINYFQDRQISVNWHGCKSVPRTVNGGGPAGSTIGILEFLSQSNHSADCVSPDDRFKFVDDLTILEIINILTIGLTSYNIKNHVPSDIPSHGQYIPPNNLRSQSYLNTINQWTENQLMEINQLKTKTMIFNFTTKYQFTTRLQLKEENIDVVKHTKLLGTIVSDDLRWDMNTNAIVKKSYARMELLRKVASFGASVEDLKQIYISYIRSILEQSCTVWHSSLSLENREDLERVQKSAFKIILQDKYIDYSNAVSILDLDILSERRKQLCLSFAEKSQKNPKISHLFKLNYKLHSMDMRKVDKYETKFIHTERLKKSSIPYMRTLLNEKK